MISHVSASALKGATFSHDLSAVSLILGDNAAGKSSIIDALQLGMRGSHPVLGKTASSIMALASGPEMVAEITDTLAGKVRRVWKRSGDKCSASNTEPLPEFPDLVGSATQYLALSPAKRVEYVAGLVTVTDAAFSFEAVTAEVKNVRLEANSEASEKAIKDYLDAITRDSVHAAPLQRIGTMLIVAADRLKSAKQTCQRMKGVVTGTEQLRAQDREAEQSGADTDRNLATARTKLGELQKQSGELRAKADQEQRQRKRRAELEAMRRPELDEAQVKAELAVLDSRLKAVTEAIEKRKFTTAQLREKYAVLKASVTVAETNIKGMVNLCDCPVCHRDVPEQLRKDYIATQEAAIATAKIGMVQFSELGKIQAEQDADSDALRVSIAALDNKLQANATALATWTAAQNELAQMGPIATEELAQAAQRTLEADLQVVRTEIATLEQARNRVIAQRADIKRQMEAGKLLEQSEAEVEVLKAIQELLREKQSQLVTKAFTPLLTVVNKFVSGVAPLQGLRGQPLEMVIQYRDGHLGFDRDGVWVSDETFNESLSLLVFAGLAVALAAAAPQRIVILDEFTRVIGLTKFNAVRRLAELVQQGVIDQAIVVDGYDAQYVPLVSTVQGKELISIIRL